MIWYYCDSYWRRLEANIRDGCTWFFTVYSVNRCPPPNDGPMYRHDSDDTIFPSIPSPFPSNESRILESVTDTLESIADCITAKSIYIHRMFPVMVLTGEIDFFRWWNTGCRSPNALVLPHTTVLVPILVVQLLLPPPFPDRSLSTTE